MAALTIARKDLRLLLRDPRALVILLVMPLLLILVLGLTLGEAFGQKPDDRIRVSVVVLDAGPPVDVPELPKKNWSEFVLDDLTDTANVRVERVETLAEAERLVKSGERSAVVVFGPDFSRRVDRCSFVDEPFKKDPINPLYRDGMNIDEVDVRILPPDGTSVTASVIQQVVQVTLMRVIIPWMIGNAFEQIGTPAFMSKMEKYIPGLDLLKRFDSKITEKLGKAIKQGIGSFFSNYQFTAKSWAGLTKSDMPPKRADNVSTYTASRLRYQILVPSYTVTFAFFLVLTVGWLFVAERRHGTLVRLRAAPISRGQVLLGKLLPCLAVSLVQGFTLLLCGKLVFGMSWGPQPLLLIPVVVSTSLAAVGLAVLVAVLAKTETQVSVYGTLLVLVMAGASGSLMPRDLMPDAMKAWSKLTPHAWALDAYATLLTSNGTTVDAASVWTSCGVLTAFGVGFGLLSWLLIRLD